MPELYRAWQAAAGSNIHFHVVSAGPWQFHEPLRRFTEEAGFPDFTWDMRSVDIMNPFVMLDETVKADPQRIYEFKLRTLRALIERMPQRRYVLVGDSGEKDPEVYATILAQFPTRVDAVYIRDVSGEKQDAPRYKALYAEPVAYAKLTVFTDPDALPRRLTFER
jgi:phosphatidate phosphatase APP1